MIISKFKFNKAKKCLIFLFSDLEHKIKTTKSRKSINGVELKVESLGKMNLKLILLLFIVSFRCVISHCLHAVMFIIKYLY